MAQQTVTLTALPTALLQALNRTISLESQSETQRTVQREIVAALHKAMDARRQRIIISESTIGPVKWAVILLQGLCALIAVAMVHSDNPPTCAITITLFATGIALAILMVAAYAGPFSGDLSVGPELLQQVSQPHGR
jgi:hypothetical protein